MLLYILFKICLNIMVEFADYAHFYLLYLVPITPYLFMLIAISFKYSEGWELEDFF